MNPLVIKFLKGLAIALVGAAVQYFTDFFNIVGSAF